MNKNVKKKKKKKQETKKEYLGRFDERERILYWENVCQTVTL